MNGSPAQQRPPRGEARRLVSLAVLAAVSLCAYGLIALLSPSFDYAAPPRCRPIPLVLALLAVALAAYLVAAVVAVRAQPTRGLLAVIVGGSILFRLVLLPTTPIQEIDIYRYLWDGSVTASGISAYRYPPAVIQRARADQTSDPTLARLVQLRDRHPPLALILSRIHYAVVPSVYPPVSQAVFAAVALSTPDGASIRQRIVWMKTWLVTFDLATLLLVIALLSTTGRHTGLCLLYGWCPLVIKEIANSGHLDSIAIFLTTLAFYLAIRRAADRAKPGWHRAAAAGLLPALALALAVGAKLYPLVLAPLLLVVLGKRHGWPAPLASSVVFVVASGVVLWPMSPWAAPAELRPAGPAAGADRAAPPALQAGAADSHDPSLGLKTFLRRWEMNDFLFLLVVENLKPDRQVAAGQRAWFTVVPDRWRRGLVDRTVQLVGVEPWEAPLLLARILTTAVFLLAAAWLSWQASRSSEAAAWLQFAFLTLAWFWLLSPTQNPWYWCWVLPFLPFARSRLWWLPGGLVFLYYLRFWLTYHWPTGPVAMLPYSGSALFDFVVTWIEFGPWLVALAVSRWWRA